MRSAAFPLLFVVLFTISAPRLSRAQDLQAELQRGHDLYADRCTQCHGETGNEKAMGRSKKLNILALSDIDAKLKKYQFGLPAKAMRDKMKSGLSEDDIRALSLFIGQFGKP